LDPGSLQWPVGRGPQCHQGACHSLDIPCAVWQFLLRHLCVSWETQSDLRRRAAIEQGQARWKRHGDGLGAVNRIIGSDLKSEVALCPAGLQPYRQVPNTGLCISFDLVDVLNLGHTVDLEDSRGVLRYDPSYHAAHFKGFITANAIPR